MPIKPKPFLFSCNQCTWSKMTFSESDALTPMEIVTHCPMCGAEVTMKQIETPQVVERLFQLFGLN